jgi:hypothetical protein
VFRVYRVGGVISVELGSVCVMRDVFCFIARMVFPMRVVIKGGVLRVMWCGSRLTGHGSGRVTCIP